MTIKDLLLDPWYSSALIFIIQILLLYLRTININYTVKQNIAGAIWSNNGISVMWLLSNVIGVHSIVNGVWQPIAAFLIGGSIGTYCGLKREIRKSVFPKAWIDK